MSDLRPTLFLAQLSNLLAGNISIVHGVTGSSRTFMGEEAAGVDAVRIALARIAAGQSDIALVGGAHNGEREDLLLLYELGGICFKDEFAPVWDRSEAAAWCSARSAPFSCSKRASMPRRAAPSRWRGCRSVCRTARAGPPATSPRRLARMWQTARAAAQARTIAVISGATGASRRPRGARLARKKSRHSGARDRHLYRPRLRAAVRHEHCARRARARSRKDVSAVRFLRASNGRMKVRSTRSSSPASAIGAAKAWGWSRP